MDNKIGGADWQREWLGTEVWVPGFSPGSNWDPAGAGILSDYLGIGTNQARSLYRCPALPEGELNSGEGSNGMFDYCMVKALPGPRSWRFRKRWHCGEGRMKRNR